MVMCTPDRHAGAERDLYSGVNKRRLGWGEGRLVIVNVCAACRVRAPVKSCVFLHLRPGGRRRQAASSNPTRFTAGTPHQRLGTRLAELWERRGGRWEGSKVALTSLEEEVAGRSGGRWGLLVELQQSRVTGAWWGGPAFPIKHASTSCYTRHSPRLLANKANARKQKQK